MIPHERAAYGAKQSIINAIRLLEDAKLLHEKKRYPTSIYACIIALEELGKGKILTQFWQAKKDIDKGIYSTLIKDHVEKSKVAVRMVQEYIEGPVELWKNKDYMKLKEDMIKSMAAITSKEDKESYLYVDWQKNRWTVPWVPRQPIPDSTVENDLRAISEIYIGRCKVALGVILKLPEILDALSQRDNEPLTTQQVIDLTRLILNRQNGSIGIETKEDFKEVIEITIECRGFEPTKEEKERLKSTLVIVLPKLKPERLHMRFV